MLTMVDCDYKQYTLDVNGDLDLWYQGFQWMALSYSGIGGKMFCQDGQGCEATMGSSSKRSPHDVLVTDYDNYAASYRCSQIGFMYTDFISIYSK